jgi:hypothetical protein
MTPWKIYLTDETFLSSNDAVLRNDVRNIPEMFRRGVHSVIQPMDLGRMRETIEQYHYLYLLAEEKWMGVGADGLIDHTAYQFNNIGAILHGRTTITDGFFRLRQTIAQDQEIIGGMSAVEASRYEEEHFAMAGSRHRYEALASEGPRASQRYQDWTDIARHRAYPPGYTEEEIYGEKRQWQN